METHVAIGIPVLLMLVMLALFGVTWLFHHHHWRPFAGVFLFVIGLACFWSLMSRTAERDALWTAPRSDEFDTAAIVRTNPDHQRSA